MYAIHAQASQYMRSGLAILAKSPQVLNCLYATSEIRCNNVCNVRKITIFDEHMHTIDFDGCNLFKVLVVYQSKNLNAKAF